MNIILSLFVAGFFMCSEPSIISKEQHYFFVRLDSPSITMWIENERLQYIVEIVKTGLTSVVLTSEEIEIVHKYSDNIIFDCGEKNNP